MGGRYSSLQRRSERAVASVIARAWGNNMKIPKSEATQGVKIGICGAQGVGKSTLAKALAKELGYPLIKEEARKIMKDMDIKSPKELQKNPDKGRKFQLACLRRQIAAEKKYTRFISDRTTIDNAAYWLKWHAHKSRSVENMAYYTLAWENAEKYDLLVYILPGIPLIDDGVRSTNESYQAEMDMLIRIFLYSWGQAYITIAAEETLEERVKRVVAEVGKGVEQAQ